MSRHARLLLWLPGGIWRSFYPLQIPQIHHLLWVAHCPNWKQSTFNIYESFFYSLALELLFSQITTESSLIWNNSGIKIQYFNRISFSLTDHQYLSSMFWTSTLGLAVLFKTLGEGWDIVFEKTITIKAQEGYFCQLYHDSNVREPAGVGHLLWT